MGSGANGPYSSGDPTREYSFSSMHGTVAAWARKQQTELKGNQKRRFNTACIAVGKETGRVYYGRNHGIEYDHSPKNPALFGDDNHPGLLPRESLNSYTIGNCAEIDAVNNALNAGAKLANLQLMTIHVTKKGFGTQKCACENCTATLKGRVAGNYSGWNW